MVESNSIQARIVSVDNIANHETPTGDFSGVVELSININGSSFLCTGALLSTGRHILTAAHCLQDNSNNTAGSASATFQLSTGDVTINSSNITIHPQYNNSTLAHDIAIIELASEAPPAAQRYDIYRNSDEVSQVFDKVGFGDFGQGSNTNGADSTKREGQNRFDTLGNIFNDPTIPDNTQLFYDFDNGSAANDAFGQEHNLNDTGLGNNEVNTATGDSGGPAFIGDRIAGVTSYGLTSSADVDSTTNSSFGEYSADTRVSFYENWVDSVLCFLSGTHILTEKGEITVENLQIGDKVLTAEGKLEPIKWIGKQTRQPYDLKNPLRSHPILIKAGALGNNLPHRDLYVSPDHAMFFEGLLINAGALVNDVSIIKTEPKETFTYYHVELDNHALLLAEGASAESYLPQNEHRLEYDNGAEYEELYPHGSNLMLWPMDYPRISSWVKVPRYVTKKLNAIAAQLSNQISQLSA